MTGQGVHVQVGGDVVGQVVVGDHNITVWAEQSVVTVVAPGERPRPVRRSEITLLPRQVSRPVGRDREITAVRKVVAEGRLAQIYGPSGAGKSTLLRYTAGQLGRPGTVFLSVASRTAGDVLQDVFEACYDTAGYRPSPVELRRLLSGVNIRLLLDDLELSDGQRDEFLDVLPDAVVIFTAERRALWAEGQSVALSGLAWEPALELLTTAMNRPMDEPEQVAAAQLWRLMEGSPSLLLCVVGAAPPGPDGRLSLPCPAELGELLPRVFSRLSALARAIISVLAISDAAVSASLLQQLVEAPASTLNEMESKGLVINADMVTLSPGLATALPPDLLPDLSQITWVIDRLDAVLPRLSPMQVYEHAPLLAGVIDAATRLGRPDLGARLAKAAAPLAACSGRLNVWQRILDQGKVAAELAGDQSMLAYFTHEASILALVTGQAAVAAAGIAAAINLWHQLGQTTHATVAQHTQSLVTGHAGSAAAIPVTQPPATHAASSAHPLPSTWHPPAAEPAHPAGGHRSSHSGHSPGHTAKATKTAKAAKRATASAKTGAGLGIKVAIAAVATTAVAGGGYVISKANTTPSHPTAIPSIVSTPGSSVPSQSTAPPTGAAHQQRGVFPTSCPTDPFFGSFDGDYSSFSEQVAKHVDPTALVCAYVKGQSQPRIGFFSGNRSPDIPGAEPIEIPGTDRAWVIPESDDQLGELVVNIGNRTMDFVFLGTTDEAIAATKRIIGLS